MKVIEEQLLARWDSQLERPMQDLKRKIVFGWIVSENQPSVAGVLTNKVIAALLWVIVTNLGKGWENEGQKWVVTQV